ncbi:hypothetical protein, partial [Pseudomonas sp. CFBP 5750]
DFCWQGNRRLAPIQTVGAKLACDDGGHPTSRQTDTLLSRASFAPTGDFCWQGNRRLAPIQTVGAKLARDDGGTSNIKAD